MPLSKTMIYYVMENPANWRHEAFKSYRNDFPGRIRLLYSASKVFSVTDGLGRWVKNRDFDVMHGKTIIPAEDLTVSFASP